MSQTESYEEGQIFLGTPSMVNVPSGFAYGWYSINPDVEDLRNSLRGMSIADFNTNATHYLLPGGKTSVTVGLGHDLTEGEHVFGVDSNEETIRVRTQQKGRFPSSLFRRLPGDLKELLKDHRLVGYTPEYAKFIV